MFRPTTLILMSYAQYKNMANCKISTHSRISLQQKSLCWHIISPLLVFKTLPYHSVFTQNMVIFRLWLRSAANPSDWYHAVIVWAPPSDCICLALHSHHELLRHWQSFDLSQTDLSYLWFSPAGIYAATALSNLPPWRKSTRPALILV